MTREKLKWQDWDNPVCSAPESLRAGSRIRVSQCGRVGGVRAVWWDQAGNGEERRMVLVTGTSNHRFTKFRRLRYLDTKLGVIKMRQEQNTPHSSQDDNKNIAAQKRKDSNPTSSLPSSKFCYWGKSFRKKNNKTEKNSSSNINKNSESTESTSGCGKRPIRRESSQSLFHFEDSCSEESETGAFSVPTRHQRYRSPSLPGQKSKSETALWVWVQ